MKTLVMFRFTQPDTFVQCASEVYLIGLSYTAAGGQAVGKAVGLFICHNTQIQYWGDLILIIFEDLCWKIWPQQIGKMKLCYTDLSFSAVEYTSGPPVK